MFEENPEKIKEYIAKFRTPENFINRILSSINHEFSIIKLPNFSVSFSNWDNPKKITNKEITAIKEVVSTKHPITIEDIDNKTKKIFRISLYPIFNNLNEVVEIIRCNNDVTKIKKLEEENSKLNKIISEYQHKLSKNKNIINKLAKEIKERLTKDKKEIEKLKETSENALINKKNKLNSNEEKVFMEILSNPLATDDEISKKTGIKRPTVTAIKNRLKKEDLFKKIYLPNPIALNYEIFALFSIELRADISPKNSPPELIFLGKSGKYLWGIFMSKRYSKFEKFIAEISRSFGDFIEGEIKKGIFINNVDNIELYNFSQLFKEFNRKQKSEKYNLATKTKKLSNNEKRILFELIKNPELPVSKLSKKIWISKPTIIKKKKELLEDRFIIPYTLPNFKKTGIKTIAIIKTLFERPIKKDLSKKEENTIIRITKNNEIIRLSFFKDEEECEQEVNKIIEFYKNKNTPSKTTYIAINIGKIKQLKKPNLAELIEKNFFEE